MTTNTIQIVALDGSIPTSYGTKGTTGQDGLPIPWNQVRRVKDYKSVDAWRASQGTAADLLGVQDDITRAGWPGLRVTEAIRDVSIVVAERAKYDNWIAAGRPDPSIPTRYSSKSMRSVYVKRPNETNHQWGGAVDVDVQAWAQDGAKKGLTGNQAMAELWGFLAPWGFTPIIAEPNLNQSEAWHFDHYGPLRVVRELFQAHRFDGKQYADVAGLTAQVGNILAGTFDGNRKMERFVQARLLIAGAWCGLPDGDIGRLTRQALIQLGIIEVSVTTPMAEILGILDRRELGLKEVRNA